MITIISKFKNEIELIGFRRNENGMEMMKRNSEIDRRIIRLGIKRDECNNRIGEMKRELPREKGPIPRPGRRSRTIAPMAVPSQRRLGLCNIVGEVGGYFRDFWVGIPLLSEMKVLQDDDVLN